MAQVAAWITGAVFKTPNAGTTGGVRVAGNATSGNSILQFVDSAMTSQWGYISATASGGLTFADGGGPPRAIGYRNIPLTAKTASYQIALTDVGQGVSTTAGVTVPPNSTTAFAVGDTITVYNNSAGSITITQGSGVTIRLVGTATTGNRTIAQRGICTLLKVGTDEWIASGGGVS